MAKWARKYIKAIAPSFRLAFGKDYPVEDQDQDQLFEFFQQYDDWTPASLLYLQTKSWGLIGASKKNADGKVYRYACCQGSQKIEHVLKHLDGIVRDTNSFRIKEYDADQCIGGIVNELASQLENDDSPDIQDKLSSLEDQLASLFVVKPAPENENQIE